MHDLHSNRGGDAPRGGDCGSDRDSGNPPVIALQPGETIRVDRITGNRIIEGGKRRSTFSRLSNEIRLHGEVPGLHAFESPMSLKFVWIGSEKINEADARDAQCRAGWADHHEGHGFFSFETFQREDGLYEATWCCWKGTE